MRFPPSLKAGIISLVNRLALAMLMKNTHTHTQHTCLFFLQTDTLNFPSGVCTISCGVSSRNLTLRPFPTTALSPLPPPSSPPIAPGPSTAPISDRPRFPQFQLPPRRPPPGDALVLDDADAAPGVVAAAAVAVVAVGEVAATGFLAAGAGLTVLALLPAALLLPLLPPPLLREPARPLPRRCAGAGAADAAAAACVAAGVSEFRDGGETGLGGGLDVGVGERLEGCWAPVAAAASRTVVAGRPPLPLPLPLLLLLLRSPLRPLPRPCVGAAVDAEEVSGLFRDGGDTRLDDPVLVGERLEAPTTAPVSLPVVAAGVAGGAYGGGGDDRPGGDRPCGTAQHAFMYRNNSRGPTPNC